MNKSIVLVPALAALLGGCVTAGPTLTEQQMADDYYSCVYLETVRDNAKPTEQRVRAAHAACSEEGRIYAAKLVRDTGMPERHVQSNVSRFMLGDLEETTVAQMRQAEVIE